MKYESNYLFYMMPTYEQIQKFSLFDNDILIRGFKYLIKLNLEYNTNLRRNFLPELLMFKKLGIIINESIFEALFYDINNNDKILISIATFIDLFYLHFQIDFDINNKYKWNDIIANNNDNNLLSNIKYHSSYLLKTYPNINDNNSNITPPIKSHFVSSYKGRDPKYIFDLWDLHPYYKYIDEDYPFSSWENLYDVFLWDFLLALNDYSCHCINCGRCMTDWVEEFKFKKIMPKFDNLYLQKDRDSIYFANDKYHDINNLNFIKEQYLIFIKEMLERNDSAINANATATDGLNKFLKLYFNNLVFINTDICKDIIMLFISYGANINININTNNYDDDEKLILLDIIDFVKDYQNKYRKIEIQKVLSQILNINKSNNYIDLIVDYDKL